MKKEILLERKHFVYGLKCPFDFEIKYIGLTSNIKKRKRLHYHVSEKNRVKNHKLYDWIDILKSNKVKPEFIILFEGNYDTAFSVEKMLIKKLSKTLFNINSMP